MISIMDPVNLGNYSKNMMIGMIMVFGHGFGGFMEVNTKNRKMTTINFFIAFGLIHLAVALMLKDLTKQDTKHKKNDKS